MLNWLPNTCPSCKDKSSDATAWTHDSYRICPDQIFLACSFRASIEGLVWYSIFYLTYCKQIPCKEQLLTTNSRFILITRIVCVSKGWRVYSFTSPLLSQELAPFSFFTIYMSSVVYFESTPHRLPCCHKYLICTPNLFSSVALRPHLSMHSHAVRIVNAIHAAWPHASEPNMPSRVKHHLSPPFPASISSPMPGGSFKSSSSYQLFFQWFVI